MSSKGTDFSEQQLQQIARWWLLHKRTVLDMAEDLGITKSAMFRLLKKYSLAGHQGDMDLYLRLYADTGDPAIAPKLNPVIYKVPKRKKTKFDSVDEISVHWGDVHVPFHDPAAIDILYQITDIMQPNVLVCHGDVTDFWQLSDHRPPFERNLRPYEINLQETIDLAARHLAQMEGLAQPDAQKIYLHGNHEDRFERLLLRIQTDTRLRHLLFIPKIAEVLDLNYLLGLQEQEWETYHYIVGNKPVLNDRLLCIHGNKSTIWSSRTLLGDYGKSLIYGHTHRIQNFTKRDLASTESAWNIGCLCSLDPHWLPQTDWAHGFAVVSWKKTSKGWLYDVDTVRIHDGVALYRDMTFKG
jgi:hypothetical protein